MFVGYDSEVRKLKCIGISQILLFQQKSLSGFVNGYHEIQPTLNFRKPFSIFRIFIFFSFSSSYLLLCSISHFLPSSSSPLLPPTNLLIKRIYSQQTVMTTGENSVDWKNPSRNRTTRAFSTSMKIILINLLNEVNISKRVAHIDYLQTPLSSSRRVSIEYLFRRLSVCHATF